MPFFLFLLPLMLQQSINFPLVIVKVSSSFLFYPLSPYYYKTYVIYIQFLRRLSLLLLCRSPRLLVGSFRKRPVFRHLFL